MIRLASLSMLLMAISPALAAGERCMAGHYRLPANIADEMRPYLVCGMLQGDGHHTTRVNGVGVSMRGGGVEACGAIRAAAFQASERRLATAMPDATARRTYLETEFGSADRLLRTANASEDLGIGEEPTAPACRSAG